MRDTIIKIRDDVNMNNISDKDILMYDNRNGCFYLTTQQTFFNKYNDLLDKLIVKYDNQFAEGKQESNDFRADMTTFKEELIKDLDNYKKSVVEALNGLKNDYNAFLIKYKETNEKLINMVEQVINKED